MCTHHSISPSVTSTSKGSWRLLIAPLFGFGCVRWHARSRREAHSHSSAAFSVVITGSVEDHVRRCPAESGSLWHVAGTLAAANPHRAAPRRVYKLLRCVGCGGVAGWPGGRLGLVIRWSTVRFRHAPQLNQEVAWMDAGPRGPWMPPPRPACRLCAVSAAASAMHDRCMRCGRALA